MTDDLRELYFYSFAFDKCNCNVYPSWTDVEQNVFFEVVLHEFVPFVTLVKQRSEGVKVFTAFGLVHDVCLTLYILIMIYLLVLTIEYYLNLYYCYYYFGLIRYMIEFTSKLLHQK